jgi:hypothetical protein
VLVSCQRRDWGLAGFFDMLHTLKLFGLEYYLGSSQRIETWYQDTRLSMSPNVPASRQAMYMHGLVSIGLLLGRPLVLVKRCTHVMCAS